MRLWQAKPTATRVYIYDMGNTRVE